MLRVPAVDLAFARREVGEQRGQQGSIQQREHGLEALAAVGHRDPRPVAEEAAMQARGQILRQERGVAGRGQDVSRARDLHRAGHARQRSAIALDEVADHGHAEFPVTFEIAVGVDQEVADLRAQGPQHVLDHRSAGDAQQALVLAAHAGGASAREYDARDLAAHRRVDAHASTHPDGATPVAARPRRMAALMRPTPGGTAVSSPSCAAAGAGRVRNHSDRRGRADSPR